MNIYSVFFFMKKKGQSVHQERKEYMHHERVIRRQGRKAENEVTVGVREMR